MSPKPGRRRPSGLPVGRPWGSRPGSNRPSPTREPQTPRRAWRGGASASAHYRITSASVGGVSDRQISTRPASGANISPRRQSHATRCLRATKSHRVFEPTRAHVTHGAQRRVTGTSKQVGLCCSEASYFLPFLCVQFLPGSSPVAVAEASLSPLSLRRTSPIFSRNSRISSARSLELLERRRRWDFVARGAQRRQRHARTSTCA